MRLLAFALLFLLGTHAILAIGITPAKSVVVSNQTFVFTPVTDGAVTVSLEGDLAEYVQLDQEIVLQGELIRGSILPLPDIPPGDYTQLLVISRVTSDGGGTVSASASVAAQLVLRIPADGPYLVPSWHVQAQNDALVSTIMIENRGDELVIPDRVRVTLEGLYEDVSVREIHSLSTEKFESRFQLPKLQSGIYDAVLEIEYEDRNVDLVREVAVGVPDFTLDSVEYDQNDPGQVRALDISGRVLWNRPLVVSASVYRDGESLPILEQELILEGTYEHRLYLETLPENSLRVVLTGAHVREKIVEFTSEESSTSSTWIIGLMLITVFCVAMLVWKLLWSRQ